MKSLFLKITAVLAMVVLLAACGAGPQAITQGFARDALFSIEPRNNGTTTLWLLHDDVGSYCTRDEAIVQRAQAVLASDSAEVVIEYRSLNNNDPEFSLLGNGCSKEGGDGHTTYLVLNLYTVAEYQAVGNE